MTTLTASGARPAAPGACEMRELLENYPVVIEAPVAWGEMDSMGHVNNIVYFRYFESGRIAYFERSGFIQHMSETGVGPILASTECRFRLPLSYPDTVAIGARVTEVGDDRFVMKYLVVSQRHARPAAEGEGLIVAFDYRAQKKAPLPEAIKARIRALEQNRER